MQIKKVFLINFLIIIILILAIELTLRVVFSYKVQGISKNLINTSLDYKSHHANLNGVSAFGHKIYTDENGFRIPKNKVINKNKKEILFIGGSVTFGAGIKAENTFVEKLDSMSNNNLKNVGIFGADLENHLKIINNFYSKTKTKKIFINLSLDDITEISAKKNLEKEQYQKSLFLKLKTTPIFKILNKFLRSKSVTYVYVKNFLLDPQINYYLYDLNLYKDEAAIKKLNSNIKNIKNIIDENTKLYFYSIPYAAQVRKENCYKKDIAEIAFADISKKNNLNYLPLKNNFCKFSDPAKLFIIQDPAHLTEKGHNLVFELLSPYLN